MAIGQCDGVLSDWVMCSSGRDQGLGSQLFFGHGFCPSFGDFQVPAKILIGQFKFALFFIGQFKLAHFFRGNLNWPIGNFAGI